MEGLSSGMACSCSVACGRVPRGRPVQARNDSVGHPG
jgi:hypothetical protein